MPKRIRLNPGQRAALNRITAKQKKQVAPLRRVVAVSRHPDRRMGLVALLACGHSMQMLYEVTLRKRCDKCLQEQHNDQLPLW